MLSQGQFLSYEDGVGIKMLRRAFPSQGSVVGGQGSGVRVKTGVKYQDFVFLELFLDYMSHRDTYSRPKAAMVACGLSESHFPPKTGRMVTLKFMMFLPHFRTSDASLLCC